MKRVRVLVTLLASLAAPLAAQGDDVFVLDGLAPVWTHAGKYVGVAVDTDGTVYATKMLATCDVLDRRGEFVRTFPLAGNLRDIQLVHVQSPLLAERERSGPDLLFYSGTPRTVQAYTAEGVPLWVSRPAEDGINEVFAVDVDGDGLDELFVGHNGRGGVRLLDAEAAPLWHVQDATNVWHVAAADVDGDGVPELVGTSGSAGVHVRDVSGKRLETFTTKVSPLLIRGVRGASGEPDHLLVGGRLRGDPVRGPGDRGGRAALVALEGDGHVRGNVELPPNLGHLQELHVHPSGAYAAVLANQHHPEEMEPPGNVVVVDLRAYEVCGRVRTTARLGQLAWMPTKDGEAPVLVVATDQDVTAVRVTR